jgi:hypothetical protein
MKLAALSLAVFASVVAGLVACAGESKNGDGDEDSAGSGGSPEGGSSGAAGSSTGGRGGTGSGGRASGGTTSTGGATTGGRGGTSPSGGDAGTAPTGGVAGAATGGVAGAATGGVGGAGIGGLGGGGGRECETAEDCILFSDCCSCLGIVPGADTPECNLVCIQSRCMADQIGPDEVTCSFGRCVIDRSCDYAKVTCNGMPEACPNGEVRSVTENGCWGPCLAPTECRDVTDCSSCGSAVCVIHEPQIATTGCVIPDSSCTKGNYCECLDACPTIGFECTEADDAVHCPCPVC